MRPECAQRIRLARSGDTARIVAPMAAALASGARCAMFTARLGDSRRHGPDSSGPCRRSSEPALRRAVTPSPSDDDAPAGPRSPNRGPAGQIPTLAKASAGPSVFINGNFLPDRGLRQAGDRGCGDARGSQCVRGPTARRGPGRRGRRVRCGHPATIGSRRGSTGPIPTASRPSRPSSVAGAVRERAVNERSPHASRSSPCRSRADDRLGRRARGAHRDLVAGVGGHVGADADAGVVGLRQHGHPRQRPDADILVYQQLRGTRHHRDCQHRRRGRVGVPRELRRVLEQHPADLGPVQRPGHLRADQPRAPKTAALEITDDSGTLDVPLSGTGITGTLSATPNPVAFTPAPWFYGGQQQSITIQDSNDAGVQVNSAVITGPDASRFSIGWGQNCGSAAVRTRLHLRHGDQLQSAQWPRHVLGPAGDHQRQPQQPADHSAHRDGARRTARRRDALRDGLRRRRDRERGRADRDRLQRRRLPDAGAGNLAPHEHARRSPAHRRRLLGSDRRRRGQLPVHRDVPTERRSPAERRGPAAHQRSGRANADRLHRAGRPRARRIRGRVGPFGRREHAHLYPGRVPGRDDRRRPVATQRSPDRDVAWPATGTARRRHRCPLRLSPRRHELRVEPNRDIARDGSRPADVARRRTRRVHR